jgi:flagellar biosynthesis protein FliR
MQIYFVSMPGQIVLGLVLLTMTASAMILAWHDSAQAYLRELPGWGGG